MLMSLARVATKGHTGVNGLLWSVLPPKIMWMSLACAASRSHADLGSMLMSVTLSAATNHVKLNDPCCFTDCEG